MADFILSCCSTADLTAEHFAARDISFVCFHYSLDGVIYPDDLGKSLSFPAFYQAMRDGAETKTSQVNVDQYVQYFTPFLEAGKDILHICFSSGLSGSYTSANIAKEELDARFPDRKLVIIDSLAAASGFGLLMDKLADLRDEGKSMDEVAAWAEAHKLNLHHWFFTTDLTFFVKGGRVSKASGWVGTILNICPLLNVNFEGKLTPRIKARGKKNVMEAMVNKMEETAEKGLSYDGKVYLSHSDCEEDAKAVAKLIANRFPNVKKAELFSIGTTIGSHTGPGTVALFYWGSKRED